MVLRRIFGPKRDEVTGEWRRLHNEELNDLCSSRNIVRVIKSRRMRWAGHVARMGEERGVYRVLVGKPEGKRPLGRPRRRWVDNIRMDLQEVGCGYMDWIGLAQNRDSWRTLVSVIMNLRVPWNVGNFLTRCKPVSCSRRTLHHGVCDLLPWGGNSYYSTRTLENLATPLKASFFYTGTLYTPVQYACTFCLMNQAFIIMYNVCVIKHSVKHLWRHSVQFG